MDKLQYTTGQTDLDPLMPQAEKAFAAVTRMDPRKLPKRYQKPAGCALETCRRKLVPSWKYTTLAVQSASEDSIVLENGYTLQGPVPMDRTGRPESVMLYVCTLRGFSEAEEEEDVPLNGYFLDAWGSACSCSLGRFFLSNISEQLKSRGILLTRTLHPGLLPFPIENQAPLFDILQPEDIGLKLSEEMLMQPVKSVSGVACLSQ